MNHVPAEVERNTRNAVEEIYKRSKMRNPIIRFLSNLFKNEVKEEEKRNHILEEIPHGEVKDASVYPAFLIHMKTHGNSPVYNLPTDREFFIGRNPENELCLKGEDVSDIHAKIRPEKESYVLYDLASKGGVNVNWEKILKHKLEHRDRIKIGSHVLIFEFVKEEELFDGIKIRKAVRIKPLMILKFLVDSDNKLEEFHGVVEDISLDGARIETEKELRKGSIIEAGISSSELSFIEVIAQVIWERTREKDNKILYEIGIQFLEMDEKSREKLEDYLAKSR